MKVKQLSFVDIIGDFVLSGGEYALLPIIDSITRLLPNVLGSSISLEEESFSPALIAR